jgi:2-keto-4-pentenoate hydratase/2-oxohepta-3-ene-1,7-dioic acid hydratase in catechol pathway
MRFVTIHRGTYAEPGIWFDDQVIGLKDAGFDDLISLISGGADAMDRATRWIEAAPRGAQLDPLTTRLTAPVPRPPKIICIGLNYRDHAEESKMAIPSVPTVFAKFPTAVTGHLHPIVLPRNSTRPDYEAELAVVIGEGGRHIPEERWREHVFGYTIFNDVSARDFQLATSQWMIGKTFDTFAPMGPYVVTPEEVPDPHALGISLRIGDDVLQQSNTSELIFKIPELIAFLSSVFTLEPGDVVSTGTPAGVGFARKPPRFLKPGDEVVIHVDRIGELRNPVVAES